MIKIAYLISYIVYNGPSRVVVNLINSLDRSRFVPVLVTLVSDKNDAEIINQVKAETEVIELDMRDNRDCLIRGRSLFAGYLKQSGVTVVHSHGIIPDMISALYGKGFLRISTIHSNLKEDYASVYGLAGRYFWAPLHICFLKRMDRCVCCSSSVYKALKGSLRNSSYVRNGISSQPADLNTAEGDCDLIGKIFSRIPHDAFIFLFAGRLIDGKKPELLVKEFVRCHSDREYLIMAGEGPLLDACRKEADRAEGHVFFPGFIKNMGLLYEKADVYVSASASEGLSISVIEAMEKGLGLFLSDIPSHREIVEISESSYLGELFRPDDFRIQMEKLRNNKKLLDRQKIRNLQLRYLSSSAMAKGYERIYIKLSDLKTRRYRKNKTI